MIDAQCIYSLLVHRFMWWLDIVYIHSFGGLFSESTP